MSTYEWESGTIVIPANQWPSFRTAVIKRWNAHLLESLGHAKSAHKEMKEKAKGLRGRNRDNALMSALFDYTRRHDIGNDCELRSLLWRWSEDNRVMIFQSPKKKDLGLLPTSKSATISVSDLTVSLNNKTRTIVWDVPENNHAVDIARSSWFGRFVMQKLNSVKWSRNSGGKIVGNNEYNRDADYEGGGGNYVTSRFGPLGESAPRRW